MWRNGLLRIKNLIKYVYKVENILSTVNWLRQLSNLFNLFYQLSYELIQQILDCVYSFTIKMVHKGINNPQVNN